MGGKSSSKQTQSSEVNTNNLNLQEIDAEYVIAGQNTIDLTVLDGGAIKAMENTAGDMADLAAATSKLALAKVSESMQTLEHVSDHAMDMVANSVRSDNQMNTETLIKWGFGSLSLAAAVLYLREGKN